MNKKNLTIMVLCAIIIALVANLCVCYHQINCTEKLLDQIYLDNEDYFLDILSETDVYNDYINSKE